MRINAVNGVLNSNNDRVSFNGAYRIRMPKELFGEWKCDDDKVKAAFALHYDNVLGHELKKKTSQFFQFPGYEYLKTILNYLEDKNFQWLKGHLGIILKPGSQEYDKLVLPEDNHFTFIILTKDDNDAYLKTRSIKGWLNNCQIFKKRLASALRHKTRSYNDDHDRFILTRCIDSIINNESIDNITSGHLQNIDVNSFSELNQVIREIKSDI